MLSWPIIPKMMLAYWAQACSFLSRKQGIIGFTMVLSKLVYQKGFN